MFFLKKKDTTFVHDKIIFFLHGYGSNAENILNILEIFQAKRPQYHYCALQAPHIWPHDEFGFQWFPLPDIEGKGIVDGLKSSGSQLTQQIDTVLNEYEILPENTIVGGFSQGGMMSLNCLYGDVSYAGIMSYSGGFFEYGEPVQNIPSLLIHGDQDQVVRIEQHLKSVQDLEKYSIHFEQYVVSGLEHSIDINGILKGIEFIDKINAILATLNWHKNEFFSIKRTI
jgi:phospholipase/carboxylesterase